MKVAVSISGADRLGVVSSLIRSAPQVAAAAGVVAVNAVASRVITDASRDITQRYNLPASYVRGLFRVGKATSEDTFVKGGTGIQEAPKDFNSMASKLYPN